MMNTPLFRKFRISECIQFIVDVINLCKANDPETLKIKPLVDTLSTTVDNTVEVYKQDQKSAYTKQLHEADQLRDNAIICLRTIAEGYAHHYDSAKNAAGTTLLAAIDIYGPRIYQMNYHAETSTLNKFDNERKTNQVLADAINLLGVTDVCDHMDEKNQAFEGLFQQRVQETAADTSTSAGELVKKATTEYRTLTDHITAYATITPSEAYTKLIGEINSLIDSYNATVASRGGE